MEEAIYLSTTIVCIVIVLVGIAIIVVSSHNSNEDRKDRVLGKLKSQWISENGNVSTAMKAGLENPPKDWTNKRLLEIGETWKI